MTPLIITCIAAMGISGVCSFMEAALYSIPWSHVEQMRKSGSKAGFWLFTMRTHVEQPITAILTLNTIANTAGATIAGSYAAMVISEQYMVFFAIAFTAGILVCSEIIPKTLGVTYCRQAAPFIGYTAHFMVALLKPLILVLGWLTRLFQPKVKHPQATEEDVNAIVGMLRRSGVIKEQEEKVINNVLALNKKAVWDIMTPRTVIFTMPSDITVKEAEKLGSFWNYSRIPVYGEDNEDLIGLVARSKILKELSQGHDDRPLSALMKPIGFILESVSLDKLLGRFLGEKEHLFAVLDEFGGLAGLVSLEDVLEEILGGEIVDETDEAADLQALARQRRQAVIKRYGLTPEE